MAKKKDLEILVKSLNKGELRKFTLHSNAAMANNKGYLVLFKKIQKGTALSLSSSNNFSQQKRYLYHTILESIVGKSSTKSVESSLLFYINCADFLFQKQIPDQANMFVKKALVLAKQNELFGYQIQLIEKEKQIRLHLDIKNERLFSEINEEENHLFENQQNLHNSRIMFNLILDYKKKYGYADKASFQELNTTLKEFGFFTQYNSNHSVRIGYYHHFSKSIFYWIQMKHQQAYLHTKELIILDEKVLSQSEHLNGLLEHVTSCVCLGRFREVLNLLEQIEEGYQKGVFGTYDNFSLKIFYYRSNYEIMSYVFLAEREKVVKKIEEVNLGIDFWRDKIPIEMRLVLASALKLGYIAIGNIRKAKKEAFFIINEKNTSIRLDAYENGLMSNLLIIFMQDDLSYLELMSSKTMTYFKGNLNKGIKQNEVNFELSKAFYNYSMTRVSKLEFLSKYKEVISTTIKSMDVVFSELYYPYLIWVNSQLANTDYLEMANTMVERNLR